MHILDTDTVIHLQAGHAQLTERMQRADDGDVVTSVVTRAEILRGRFEFLLKASNRNELLRAHYWLGESERVLDSLPIIGINAAAADQFERLRQVRGLRRVGRADLLIACIALAERATLVTRNLRHFSAVPHLRVENWVD